MSALDTSEPSLNLVRPSAATLRWKTAMKWVRRLHLYSGLLLFPWVILYGLTACLFNHPDLFSDRQVRETLDIPHLPAADTLAAQLVKSIQDKSEADGITGKQFRLKTGNSAFYSRNLTALVTLNDGQTMTVSLNLATGQATTRTRSAKPANPNASGPAFAKGKHTLEDGPLDVAKDAIPKALKEAGLDCKEVQVQNAPDLEFQLEVDGDVWDMRYNLQRGSLAARNNESTSNLTVRNFLLRLHTAHGYPNEQNIRWYWAIVVDVMFVAMVFWGISGLFMWWQLKAQRSIGVILVIVSAVLATWLTWGMHAMLSK